MLNRVTKQRVYVSRKSSKGPFLVQMREYNMDYLVSPDEIERLFPGCDNLDQMSVIFSKKGYVEFFYRLNSCGKRIVV